MHSQLCVALDGSDRRWILDTARQLGPHTDWLKIGLEAFSAFGPDLVRQIAEEPPALFLDVKLHDIPNTVARAAAACARLGVGMVNVHAAGGSNMMRAALEAVREVDPDGRTKLIAVTVLTSLGASELAEVGFARTADDLVVKLASLAREAGLAGVVASAREATAIRKACGPGFLIVTPGIRPAAMAPGDQRRVVTPRQACENGADILVIGRPITGANDPVGAIRSIRQEMVE